MADEPTGRKRSRFDQTEPDPPRKSRFDRRSRSPARPESAGDRDGADRSSAAAAAAAAAAKINAQINAKKNLQSVDVPPIRSTASPVAGAGGAKSPTDGAAGGNADDVYTQDGDYIKDIEVNDLRNRYTLTKGSTQKMIKDKTGADVTTRGNYYPDKSMATAANPPLYLHVTSTTKDGLERAVKEIDELMKQELPNLIDERRLRRREEPQIERDSFGRRKWPEERIPIDLEPIPGFNLRAQVVGSGGSYVKHIQQETGCRVQIKGRGSGFREIDTNEESDEQMYLHVTSRNQEDVDSAKTLCIDLLGMVRQAYEEYKARPSRNSYSSNYGGGERHGGYQHRERNGGSGSYGGGGDNNNYGGYQAGYGGQQSPPAQPQAQADPSQLSQMQQALMWVQYYAQNPSADPYKDYGGYVNVMASQYGQNWHQHGMGQAGGQSGADANEQPPPPPPPADDVPPPPPPPDDGAGYSSGTPQAPGTQGAGGYTAIPPPPGL